MKALYALFAILALLALGSTRRVIIDNVITLRFINDLGFNCAVALIPLAAVIGLLHFLRNY